MKIRHLALALGLLVLPGLAFAEGTGTPEVTHTSVAATGTPAANTFGTKAKALADKEIDRRIKNLTDASTRVGAMTRVADADKANLQSTIASQISALNDLKAKIDGDTVLADLKTDIQSVTKAYRIYALLLPQINLVASADRIVTITGQMSLLEAKLAARIASSTADTTALVAADTDLKAKLADANTQAGAAVSAVAALQPDNGDKTIQKANEDALKAARAKIQAATQDLVAARKDVSTIQKGLMGNNGKKEGEKSASTTSEHN